MQISNQWLPDHVLYNRNDPNVTHAARMAPALYVVFDMAVAVARCAGYASSAMKTGPSATMTLPMPRSSLPATKAPSLCVAVQTTTPTRHNTEPKCRLMRRPKRSDTQAMKTTPATLPTQYAALNAPSRLP